MYEKYYTSDNQQHENVQDHIHDDHMNDDGNVYDDDNNNDSVGEGESNEYNILWDRFKEKDQHVSGIIMKLNQLVQHMDRLHHLHQNT